jgi:hypothetical protein
MDQGRSKVILGLRIIHGPIYSRKRYNPLSFHQIRTTLTKRISMKIGKIRKMKNFNKIFYHLEEIPSKHNLMDITTTINSQQ